MSISIYIPVFNQREELRRTLRALIPEKGTHEVVVVDLGSSDHSQDIAAEHDWVTLKRSTSSGTPSALNEAVSGGSGDILFFLRPGSLPARGWSEALESLFSQDVDAGHMRVKETDAPSPWAAALRSIATRIGHQILGGPQSLNGVAVKRSSFEKVEGFRPVPDFAWLAFATRLRESGAKVSSIAHDVLVSPAPGAQHVDAWLELKEDLLAAWNYRKTENFDAVRCRRQTSAAIVLGADLFPADSAGEYFDYAQQEVVKLTLEMMQSYRGVDKLYYLGKEKSIRDLGQPSGVEMVAKPRTALQKRFEELVSHLHTEKREGLLLVRAISPALTHETLRALCEGPAENTCRILPEEETGQWVALWVEAEAFEALKTWELDPSIASLQAHLKTKIIRQDIENGIRALRTDSDARALYFSGVLDQVPA